MPDLPSNSHKAKTVEEGPTPKPAEDRNIKKVVQSEVVVKKPGIWAKFKNTFLGGDLSSVARYVGYEVLLPTLKNLAVDVASRGAENLFLGESGTRRSRGSSGSSGPRFQYDTPLRRDQRYGQAPERRSMQSGNRHEIGQIFVQTKEEADKVLEVMVDCVDQYGDVSVSDMKEMLGIKSSFVDRKWGWTSMRGSAVLQDRDGYLIDLPPIEIIAE